MIEYFENSITLYSGQPCINLLLSFNITDSVIGYHQIEKRKDDKHLYAAEDIEQFKQGPIILDPNNPQLQGITLEEFIKQRNLKGFLIVASCRSCSVVSKDILDHIQTFKRSYISEHFYKTLNKFIDEYNILNSRLIKIDKNIMPFKMHFAFNKENFILRENINLALIEFEQNGEILKLKKKYNIDDE